jgi:hypothetical protein
VSGDHAGRSSNAPWRALAATLALTGALCLVLWADRSSSGPATESGPATGEASVPGSRSAPPVAPTPRPVRLVIADIGVDTALTGLGLRDDGTVEVPGNPLVAGWYRLGPPPGAEGSAVILGHVDSVDGPAVFARLGELARGDAVDVTLRDGRTVSFVVRSVRTYANADFPARRVYGAHGRPQLNLVTCGGEYDATRGGYQANVVVNARATGS